jgi:hypothetical protein
VCKQKISLKGFERNLLHGVHHRCTGHQLVCGTLGRVTLISAWRILAPLALRSRNEKGHRDFSTTPTWNPTRPVSGSRSGTFNSLLSFSKP